MEIYIEIPSARGPSGFARIFSIWIPLDFCARKNIEFVSNKYRICAPNIEDLWSKYQGKIEKRQNCDQNLNFCGFLHICGRNPPEFVVQTSRICGQNIEENHKISKGRTTKKKKIQGGGNPTAPENPEIWSGPRLDFGLQNLFKNQFSEGGANGEWAGQ